MTEKKIRERIKLYFNISELVGKRTYKKYGEKAWDLLDIRLLHGLLIIREGLNRQIYINYNGKQQRGLRTIVQQIVKNFTYRNKLYVSMHLFGKAVDMTVEGMSAEEVRQWIISNKYLFPFKFRLEKNVNWVHFDVKWHNKKKVYLFSK